MKNKSENVSVQKTDINWYPGHMAKTKRLISENYQLIDFVFEVIDARIPFSSKIKDIDELIKNKPRILVMTKKDLCDLSETNKWVTYYEEQGYKVVLADLNNQNDMKNIINACNEIKRDITLKRQNKGIIKTEVRALVVGIPNVGKSTLINTLANRHVAKTGNMPGVTKDLVWLKTNLDILLLDSPGILWPKFDKEEIALNLASMTAIKNEVLPYEEVAIHILKKLSKYYPELLKNYGLTTLDDDWGEIYDTIGHKLNMLIRGGEVDYDRINMAIINDIKNEKIKGITFDRK